MFRAKNFWKIVNLSRVLVTLYCLSCRFSDLIYSQILIFAKLFIPTRARTSDLRMCVKCTNFCATVILISDFKAFIQDQCCTCFLTYLTSPLRGTVLSGTVLSVFFALFCLGLFCLGLFCKLGLLCLGLFCLFTTSIFRVIAYLE